MSEKRNQKENAFGSTGNDSRGCSFPQMLGGKSFCFSFCIVFPSPQVFVTISVK